MSENCALYVRVSSDLQDYERQIAELKKYADDNGYSLPDNALFEDKLSGFKDETQREGLRNLLDYVLARNIKIVLVWEISRLARKQMHLLRLADFFEVNGINVRFLKQGFWLLDENNKRTVQAGMSIAMLGWYGEYEATLMKDRFLSQKRLNETHGIYNGGKIPFGYKTDDGGKYVINDDKLPLIDVSPADIVREVFNLYESGLVCSKICRICRSKGYPKIVCNNHTLARLLRNTTYIGYKNVKLGVRPTPLIISEAQYSIVAGLVELNKTKSDKGRRHIYLLRGVLKCSECSGYLVGKQTDDAYICAKNSGSNKANKNSYCSGLNISVSNIDGIVWNQVKEQLKHFKADGFDDIITEQQVEISSLNQQIERFRTLMGKSEMKRKKANTMFLNDGYTEAEYARLIKEINNEKLACQKDITRLEIQIKNYEQIQKGTDTVASRIENINSITDRLQMRTIIQGLIREVTFYRVSLFKTVIYIRYTWGQITECIIYNSVQQKQTVYKLLNPFHIQFNPAEGKFYFRKTPIRKEIKKSDLRTVMPVEPTVKPKAPSNVTDPRQLTPMLWYTPKLGKPNAIELCFDDVYNLENPDCTTSYLTTREYSKLTYFKELKRERFSRKKKKKTIS